MCQAGAALVEMVILAPLLIILVFGITELGRALYQQNTLTKCVTAGARYMARAYGVLDENCAITGSWDAYEAKARNLVVYGVLDPGAGDEPLLSHLDEAGNVGIDRKGPETIDVDVSGETQTISACVITVSGEAVFDGLFGESIVPILDLGGVTLNAAAEERYIGE
jgi:hypothetical protein